MSESRAAPNTGSERRALLITGCYRSGTTVLEKILHMHEGVILASQPFPVLYFFVKELFLEERGLRRRYPLDHLFHEQAYQPEDFHAFLDRKTLTDRDVSVFFDRMEAYAEGLWTPEMTRFRGQVRPGTFLEIQRQLLDCVSRLFPKNGARYLGSKEILAEEFVSYLLARGATAIIVLRDPRALISSLNFHDRDNLTGQNRPILYSLRAWRKSVAIAFACEGKAGFHWLKYEDLVQRPNEALERLTRFLGLTSYPAGAFGGGIRDQYGKSWKGNSSFSDRSVISTDSVRAFERKLPPEVIEYVETVCYPEMQALGYDFRRVERFDPAVLGRFREPFPVIHERFPSDYSWDPGRVARERERFAKLKAAAEDMTPPVAQNWFLGEVPYRRLRATLT